MSVYHIAIALLLLVPAAVAANPKVDAIFAEYSENTPGCAVGVSQNSKMLFSKGYGMANLEHGIPITPTTVFNVASVSKQFTAASIAKLILSGELSLTTRIRDYFPNLPAYAEDVTVEHLIRHTSGIRDYIMLTILQGNSWDDSRSDKEILAMLQSQERLNFLPGSEHVYNNSGYVLLGWLVEKITGQKLEEFAAREIFDPAGMSESWFRTDYRVVPRRATDYVKAKHWLHVFSRETVVGDGGLHTTVEDLLKWHDFLYSSTAKSLSSLTHTTGKLNDGSELLYAFGLDIGMYEGFRTVSHGGSTGGYRANLVRFPEKKLSIALACNRSDANVYRLAILIARVFFPELLEPTEVAEKPGFDHYVGTYEIFPGNHIEFEIVDGSLQVAGSDMPLTYLGPDTFLSKQDQETFVFQRGSEGVISALLRRDLGIGRNLRKMSAPISFRPSEFVGRYYSESLDVEYAIEIKDSKPLVAVAFAEPRILIARDIDTLESFGRTFRFQRNGQRQITGFELDAYRTKGVSFRKVSSKN